MIPAVVEILRADPHIVSSTIYAAFIPSGILPVWLYARRGMFDVKAAFPLCLGGVVSSYIGAAFKASISGTALMLALAVIVFLAGVNILFPLRFGQFRITEASEQKQWLFLVILGSIVGVLGGLTGAGGPVLTVPVMISCGFPIMVSVSAGVLFAIPSGISGSIANIANGYIDWLMFIWVTACLLGGNVLGVVLSSRIAVQKIKLIVAVLCIGSAIFMLFRNLI